MGAPIVRGSTAIVGFCACVASGNRSVRGYLSLGRLRRSGVWHRFRLTSLGPEHGDGLDVTAILMLRLYTLNEPLRQAEHTSQGRDWRMKSSSGASAERLPWVQLGDFCRGASERRERANNGRPAVRKPWCF